MSFHPEILKPRQGEVLHTLGPAATRHGFYLGGGTAIALHLGHRRSVDAVLVKRPDLPGAREIREMLGARWAGRSPTS